MFINDVFTKKQTMITYSYGELISLLNANAIRLRDSNQLHVRMIKKYILDNAFTNQIYFPPFVANLEHGKLADGKPKAFTIVDGTQRLKALSQLEDMMIKAIQSEKEEEIKKGYQLQFILENTHFAMQIFEGLSQQETDQLYIDLNTKGKAVSLSKRISYDSRNHLNGITNAVLQSNSDLQIAGVEMEKRAIIRPKNTKLLSLSQLRQLVAVFLTGKQHYKKVDNSYNYLLSNDQYVELINTFFQELFSVYPASEIGNYRESMLASFPLLLSIVFYINQDMLEEPFEIRKEVIIDRMQMLKFHNWARTNPIWLQFEGINMGKENYYYLSNNKESIEKLVLWLQTVGR